MDNIKIIYYFNKQLDKNLYHFYNMFDKNNNLKRKECKSLSTNKYNLIFLYKKVIKSNL